MLVAIQVKIFFVSRSAGNQPISFWLYLDDSLKCEDTDDRCGQWKVGCQMAAYKERLKKACPKSCGYCQETTKGRGNIMSKVRRNLILGGI